MKVLTIIATIMMPLTVITGIYGMNFERMPFLRSSWGFYGILGVMAAVAVGMLFYFRRKRWL
jgi:magnesium transporter